MSSVGNESAEIEVRNDGIYLILNNMHPTGKPSRQHVIGLVDAYGIKDVNVSAITDAFASSEPRVERKISSNTHIAQEPESAKVNIDKDGLAAELVFVPPVNGGKPILLDKLKGIIKDAGIKYGLDEAAVEKLHRSHEYMKPYIIARGLPPTQGTDGTLQFHVDLSKKKHTPKMLEDGKVDFRKLGLIELATQGQRLVSIIPETPGQDGINVYGATLPAKKVRPAPPLPRGKNTALSHDEKSLVASVSGQIIFDSKRINISPVLEIAKDVDNTTGDIEFNGSIIIRGAVLTGFSVSAPGNIEVYGVVEGAKITSDGDIFLYRGVQGQSKAEITAGGNINTKFAENASLVAGKNIIGDSIMHSSTMCGGSLELSGKRGLLVGGKTVASDKIIANTIGSPMATLTELEVGHNPERLNEFKSLSAELNNMKQEYTKLEKTIEVLDAQNKKGQLNDERKNLFLKAIQTRAFMRNKLMTLQEQVSIMMPIMQVQSGAIVAYTLIHSGVKVLIGNAVMYIRDDIKCSRLINVDGKVTIAAL
ncbi:MAG: FapA family protein [Clostridiales bacterium]|jgi:uncharacterized protein (DUF342 family)|nr:FapA family protein [Clostridiales bacterium]